MPLPTFTASFRWFLLRHIHSVLIPLSFSSLSQPQVETCDGFLPWLERKAGSWISSSLSIGESSYGRSLFASKTIRTGDCILKVPYGVQITAYNLPAEFRSLISHEVGNIAKLAVVLLIEQKLGQHSEWNPYISCLPWQVELHNTIFWNERELEMIHQSSVYQETINQKSQIEKDFLTISPVLDGLRQRFGDVTYKDFMYACTLVGSRAWGSTKGLSLVLLLLLLIVIMLLVLIRYGKFSNATLMLDFGFTVPYNIHDEVHIQLDVPKHDPLHDMKSEILQRYYVPQTKDMKHPTNFFTIKEVRSARGKGKGLPQSLRAFARVLSCTNSQELDNLIMEAAQTDGRLARRPLPNVSKEIKAHMMLLSLITRLIEERSTTIMSLESSDLPFVAERFLVRRVMARDLLCGELRILKSASAWLENYCFSLT